MGPFDEWQLRSAFHRLRPEEGEQVADERRGGHEGEDVGAGVELLPGDDAREREDRAHIKPRQDRGEAVEPVGAPRLLRHPAARHHD